MKYLIIIISVLLAHSFPAAAHYPFSPGRVAVDTAVTPVGDPEFIEGIFAGGSGSDDEMNQDGNAKKKGTAKTTKSTSSTTTAGKNVL